MRKLCIQAIQKFKEYLDSLVSILQFDLQENVDTCKRALKV